ncbi:hypothetical protein Gotur_025940 [Gossypium turneri]
MLRERSWNSRDDIWKMVWKFPQLQRVWLFLWLAFKERLLTQVERVRQELGDGECCIVCGNAPKDVVHTFRNCSATKELGLAIYLFSKGTAFYGVEYRDVNIEEGNWVILNTDGAVKLNSKLATARGVFKDRNGGWILGFNRSLGCYSQEALRAIQESFFTTSSSAFIQHIQQNLLDIGQWKLEYIPRKMNFEVDYITKVAFDRNKDLHLVEDIPLV